MVEPITEAAVCVEASVSYPSSSVVVWYGVIRIGFNEDVAGRHVHAVKDCLVLLFPTNSPSLVLSTEGNTCSGTPEARLRGTAQTWILGLIA